MISSDSSSSEDEESNMKLMEAVTNEFTIKDTKVEPLPSVRTKKDEDNNNNFDQNITPEFRKHMSKKLAKYLDSVIEVVDQPMNSKCKKTKGGIFLLNKSTKRSTYANYEMKYEIKTKQKRKLSSSCDSDEEYKKFASIAVNGDDILNGGEGTFAKHKSETNTNKELITNNSNNKCIRKKHKKKKNK